MTSDRITAALREASDTRTVAIVAGRLAFVDDVFAESFGNVPAVVIADENTWDAAGRVVEERLRTAGRSLEARTIFPRRPPLRTEYEVIERLRDSLNAHRAIPVAVGAGHRQRRGQAGGPRGRRAVHGGGHGRIDGRLRLLRSDRGQGRLQADP